MNQDAIRTMDSHNLIASFQKHNNISVNTESTPSTTIISACKQRKLPQNYTQLNQFSNKFPASDERLYRKKGGNGWREKDTTP